MFSPLQVVGEPSPEEGGPTGGGRRVNAATRWIGRGAKKAKPILAKAGFTAVKALRKLTTISFATLERLFEVLKQRVKNRKTQDGTLRFEETTDQTVDASPKAEANNAG